MIRISILVLLIFTGINAVVAGSLFVLKPDGSGLGLTTDYLRFSPFANYFVPGLVLFTVIGIGNLLAAYAVWKRKRYARALTRMAGTLLCGWIVMQIFFVRDINALHVVMFSIGLALLLGGLLQSPWQKN